MKRLLPLPALLLVGMCTTVQSYANCDTARAMIRAAEAAAARYCPMEVR